MDWDARQKELEDERDATFEARRRRQPGVGSSPKDFFSFHDIVARHREAAERLRVLLEERVKHDPTWKPR